MLLLSRQTLEFRDRLGKSSECVPETSSTSPIYGWSGREADTVP
jgi:hypothetical protein